MYEIYGEETQTVAQLYSAGVGEEEEGEEPVGDDYTRWNQCADVSV